MRSWATTPCTAEATESRLFHPRNAAQVDLGQGALSRRSVNCRAPAEGDLAMGMLAHIEGHLNLLSAMIQRTGASLTNLDGYAGEAKLRNAIGRCIMCVHQGECRTWLAGAESGSPPPTFCSNAALLSSLSRDRSSDCA
jgi:hypothetical protein